MFLTLQRGNAVTDAPRHTLLRWGGLDWRGSGAFCRFCGRCFDRFCLE
ncbi:DUF1534 domain-containing protein [Pseudomonas syringae]|nr:DUF1534 domain-containing protein [Pseudomonas syringae]